MHIARIDVDYLPPLESIVFDFDERVNLFVGPNASGKSTILRAVKEMHSLALSGGPPPTRDGDTGRITNVPTAEADVGTLYLNYDSVNEDRPMVIMETSRDWPRNASGARWSAVPLLYIPATRVHLAGMHVFGKSIRETPPDIQLARIELAQSINRPLFDSDSERFIGPYVKSLISVLPEALELNQRQKEQFSVALQIGYSCAKNICSEVIRGASPRTYVEVAAERDNSFEGNLFESILARHYNMGIVTSDDILGDGLYTGALSAGTQGTLLWVYALALRMGSHYGWKEGWEKKPAILLIDEIENHLHPTWQRRVIPALLEHFPGLQIFATTHSPFVVAGLKARQVHLLKRDENGRVTATTNTEDVIGWTADEILRNMMGVEEPTDQLTVDRANRLRQLREKETLTPDEESELNELRRQVNEDLLSKGGPLEAQRERYADLMERFLISRQSELTQDGDKPE